VDTVFSRNNAGLFLVTVSPA